MNANGKTLNGKTFDGNITNGKITDGETINGDKRVRMSFFSGDGDSVVSDGVCAQNTSPHAFFLSLVSLRGVSHV